jgi:hypothetical protein
MAAASGVMGSRPIRVMSGAEMGWISGSAIAVSLEPEDSSARGPRAGARATLRTLRFALLPARFGMRFRGGRRAVLTEATESDAILRLARPMRWSCSTPPSVFVSFEAGWIRAAHPACGATADRQSVREACDVTPACTTAVAGHGRRPASVPIVIVSIVPIAPIGEDDTLLHLPDGLIGEVEGPLTVPAAIPARFSQIFTRFLEMPKRRFHARRRIGRGHVEMRTAHDDAEQSDSGESADFPTVDHASS